MQTRRRRSTAPSAASPSSSTSDGEVVEVRHRLWIKTKFKPLTWSAIWCDEAPSPTITVAGIGGIGAEEAILEAVIVKSRTKPKRQMTEPHLEFRLSTDGPTLRSFDEPAPTVMASGMGYGNNSTQTTLVGAPPDPGPDPGPEPHLSVRQRADPTGRRSYSFDRPAPTVKADGMSDGNKRSDTWLVGAPPDPGHDPHLEVRSANEVRDVRMRVELDEPAKCVSANGMGGGNRAQTRLVGVPPDPGADPASTRVDAGDKPIFRLPSMADIERARGSTGLRVVSTFSGCGGSCLGLEMAGYDIRYASEFVEAARDTYKLNHPEHIYVDPRDIRAVKPEEILERLGIAKGELDLLEGSPPCASFSTAGNRDKDWGKVKAYSDVKQRTDDLFFEWARLLEGLMPRVFVAENVSGLVKGKAFGYFKMILQKLESVGYVVGAKVLDAQWLGVPQQRQRLIFIGVRADIAERLDITSKTVPFPKPLRYYFSMRDALPHLRSVVHDTSGLFGQGEVIDKPSPAITVGVRSVNSMHYKVDGPEPRDDVPDAPWDADAHHPIHADPANFAEPDAPFAGDARLYVRDGFRAGATIGVDEPAPTVMAAGMGGVHRSQMLLEEPRIDPTRAELEEARSKVKGYAIEGQYDKTPQGTWNRKYFNLFKPHPDRPLPTVTAIGGGAGVASVVHPFERRKFTIRELRRLCAFPDDFKLTGSYAQQWERLGRSVPPRMMYHVGATLRDRIFGPLGLLRDGWTEAP